MLREIRNIEQDPAGPARQWFADAFFNLWVWRGEDGRVLGFQLCYDVSGDQRALSWSEKSGYAHNRVDDGEPLVRLPKAAPILVPDGGFDPEDVAVRFRRESREMENGLADFIHARILESPRLFDFDPRYSII